MAGKFGSLILVRYLLLMLHLILVATLLTSRKANVLASLPFEYSTEEYGNVDYDFKVDLSLSVAFVILELVTFSSGLTMFSSMATLMSILAHFLAIVLLCLFTLEQWDSHAFWWTFALGNCVPLTFDIGSIILNLLTQHFNKFYS